MNKSTLYFLTTLLFALRVCNAQAPLWQLTNGPYTGTAFQGSTADTAGNIFVAVESGGIFRSSDGGCSWSLSDYFDTYPLKMGTDQFGNVYASVLDLGLLRTTNSGNQWTIQNSGLPEGAEPVTFARLDSSNFMMGIYPPGIFYTTNRGENWTQFAGSISQCGRIGAIRQLSSKIIFLGSVDSGMFRSTDHGGSWTHILTFPLAATVRDIEVLHTGRILAATETDGVYASDDSGDHWNNLLGGQFSYFWSIGVTGQDTIYAHSAIQGIYRSTDNGDSWQYLGIYNQTIRSMVCCKNGDVFIFAGTAPYVLRAGRTTWDIMQIPSLVVTSLASKGNMVFVGGAFFRTSDGGQTWSSSTLNEVYDFKIDRFGNLFAAVWGGRVWKSTNNGDSWQQVLPATIDQSDAYSLAIDTSGTILSGIGTDYFGSYDGTIFKSTDDGNSWQESNQGLGQGSVLALLVTDKNSILATNNYNGLYRSSNVGITWELSSNGLPSASSFLAEALVEDSQHRIYCGTMNNGIFISTDDGNTWQASNTAMSHLRVFDILIVDRGNENIFAATDAGVYRSTDKAMSWQPYSTGITNPYVTALTVDSSGYIYAGTYGTGLYRSVQPLTSITEREHLLPFSYYVYNYPNPFNPTTNIEFSIAHSTFVRLDIFDLLGRLISTLVSERMQPGIYTRRWDGSRVTSGVYLCRIQTEDFRSTKKIVLIK